MRAGSGLMDIGGQEHILADRIGCQTRQLKRLGQAVEELPARTGEHRRDIDEELVDEAFLQESRGEDRSALEHERLDAFCGELTELLGERTAAKLELRALGERSPAEG